MICWSSKAAVVCCEPLVLWTCRFILVSCELRMYFIELVLHLLVYLSVVWTIAWFENFMLFAAVSTHKLIWVMPGISKEPLNCISSNHLVAVRKTGMEVWNHGLDRWNRGLKRWAGLVWLKWCMRFGSTWFWKIVGWVGLEC